MEEAVSAVRPFTRLGPYWAQAIRADYVSFRPPRRRPHGEGRRHAIFRQMRFESGRALFETLNWWLDPFMTTMVPLRRLSTAPPIFAVSGGRDVIHPPATVREPNADRAGDPDHA